MNCHIHEQKHAKGACVYCGHLFCEDCLVEVDGKMYCKEHIIKLLNDKNQSANQNNYGGNQEYYRSTNADHNVRPYEVNNHYIYNSPHYRYKSRVITLLLCIFFGYLGFHRFYTGKIGTGLLYFFTGGLFGIGYIIDIILIVTGSFRDVNGAYLD